LALKNSFVASVYRTWTEWDPETKTSTPKKRASVVFHELSENYYGVSPMSYQTSHNLAVADEMKFLINDARRSKRPGFITIQ
jgi:hypothetical protein